MALGYSGWGWTWRSFSEALNWGSIARLKSIGIGGPGLCKRIDVPHFDAVHALGKECRRPEEWMASLHSVLWKTMSIPSFVEFSGKRDEEYSEACATVVLGPSEANFSFNNESFEKMRPMLQVVIGDGIGSAELPPLDTHSTASPVVNVGTVGESKNSRRKKPGGVDTAFSPETPFSRRSADGAKNMRTRFSPGDLDADDVDELDEGTVDAHEVSTADMDLEELDSVMSGLELLSDEEFEWTLKGQSSVPNEAGDDGDGNQEGESEGDLGDGDDEQEWEDFIDAFEEGNKKLSPSPVLNMEIDETGESAESDSTVSYAYPTDVDPMGITLDELMESMNYTMENVFSKESYTYSSNNGSTSKASAISSVIAPQFDWEMRKASRRKGREDAILTHALIEETKESLLLDDELNEEDLVTHSLPSTCSTIATVLTPAPITAQQILFRTFTPRPPEGMEPIEWFEAWLVKMRSISDVHGDHHGVLAQYSQGDKVAVTCAYCGLSEISLLSPFVYGQTWSEWLEEEELERERKRSEEGESGHFAQRHRKMSKESGGEYKVGGGSFGSMEMEVDGHCGAKARERIPEPLFTVVRREGPLSKGADQRTKYVTGAISAYPFLSPRTSNVYNWKPYDSLVAEQEATICASDGKRVHRGSVVVHECCAEFMCVARCEAFVRLRRTRLQRTIDTVMGLGRGKSFPLGPDSMGNTYWAFYGSPALYVSIRSPSAQTSLVHAASEPMCFQLIEEKEAQLTSSSYVHSSATRGVWFRYKTVEEMRRVFEWLDPRYPTELRLRDVLSYLFPFLLLEAPPEGDEVDVDKCDKGNGIIVGDSSNEAATSGKENQPLVAAADIALEAVQGTPEMHEETDTAEPRAEGHQQENSGHSVADSPSIDSRPIIPDTVDDCTAMEPGTPPIAEQGLHGDVIGQVDILDMESIHENEKVVETRVRRTSQGMTGRNKRRIADDEEEEDGEAEWGEDGNPRVVLSKPIKKKPRMSNTLSHKLGETSGADSSLKSGMQEPLAAKGLSRPDGIVNNEEEEDDSDLSDYEFDLDSISFPIILEEVLPHSGHHRVFDINDEVLVLDVREENSQDSGRVSAQGNSFEFGATAVRPNPTLSTWVPGTVGGVVYTRGLFWNAKVKARREDSSNVIDEVAPRKKSRARYLYLLEYEGWSSFSIQWIPETFVFAVNKKTLLNQKLCYKKYLKIKTVKIPEELRALNASKYLTKTGRTHALQRSLTQPIPYSYSVASSSSPLYQLKMSMLMIEAALPLGSVDDSDDRWGDDFVVPWRAAVIAAEDPTALMECQVMLEYGIRSQWLHAFGSKLMTCLPSRSHSLRFATLGLIAMRIWTLDQAVRYDKVAYSDDDGSVRKGVTSGSGKKGSNKSQSGRFSALSHSQKGGSGGSSKAKKRK